MKKGRNLGDDLVADEGGEDEHIDLDDIGHARLRLGGGLNITVHDEKAAHAPGGARTRLLGLALLLGRSRLVSLHQEAA
jgi:hypothetical protein